MLRIRCPLSRLPEREYIYRVILEDFLGIPFSIEFEERSDLEMTMPEVNEHKLIVSDVLLQIEEIDWLTVGSLPSTPLDRMLLKEGEDVLPVIYGIPNDRKQYVDMNSETIHCGLDVFGSCFFMLTRYEEVVITERDLHDRFPAKQSLAYREGFLDYPIVNKYTELLWSLMERLWPGLTRKMRKYSNVISHDVDHPFYSLHRSRLSIAKGSLADIIRRGQFEMGFKKARMLCSGKSNLSRDPFNTFNWLMDLSEQAGIRSSFYFITEHTEPVIDGNYHLEDHEIQDLMRNIHARGHEIGLHPSYHTYLSGTRIKHQFDRLRNAAEKAHIMQENWGGRQHFLRWKAPDTWQFWEDAGLQYDSTLGYSDMPGFRCGVCYAYPVFNLVTRRPLKLIESPLIIMEQTLLEQVYGGMNTEQAFDAISRYRQQCAKYNGDFTMLWHNSYLVRSRHLTLFKICMEQLK